VIAGRLRIVRVACDGFRDIDGQPFYERQSAVPQGWADGTRDSAEWHGDHFNGSHETSAVAGNWPPTEAAHKCYCGVRRRSPQPEGEAASENQQREHGIAVLNVTPSRDGKRYLPPACREGSELSGLQQALTRESEPCDRPLPPTRHEALPRVGRYPSEKLKHASLRLFRVPGASPADSAKVQRIYVLNGISSSALNAFGKRER